MCQSVREDEATKLGPHKPNFLLRCIRKEEIQAAFAEAHGYNEIMARRKLLWVFNTGPQYGETFAQLAAKALCDFRMSEDRRKIHNRLPIRLYPVDANMSCTRA